MRDRGEMSAAELNVREAQSAAELFYVHNETYTGMSKAAMAALDGGVRISAEPVIAANGKRYCLESTHNGRSTRALLARLKDGTPRSTTEVLGIWNDADIAIATGSAAAHLLAEVHPDADLPGSRRGAGAGRRGPGHGARPGPRAVAGARRDGRRRARARCAPAARARAARLPPRRRRPLGGGPRPPAGPRAAVHRAGPGVLCRNIRDGVRSVQVRPEQLDGLPEDFRAEHPAGEDGLVTLTTEYPDLLPVRTYATDPSVRLALTTRTPRGSGGRPTSRSSRSCSGCVPSGRRSWATPTGPRTTPRSR